MSNSVAVTVTKVGTAISPYPPSFGSNAWAYGASLASIMSIGIFAVLVLAWMMRDIWRDRFIDHPRSLCFCFRLMILCAASAACIRSWPEVIFMTLYGDPRASPEFIAMVLTFKRALDVIALPFVVGWMAILISLYPFVVLILRASPGHNIELDPSSAWPRLIRPAGIFFLVVIIATLMAIAKGAGIAK